MADVLHCEGEYQWIVERVFLLVLSFDTFIVLMPAVVINLVCLALAMGMIWAYH